MGVGAHALDELQRPAAPDPHLAAACSSPWRWSRSPPPRDRHRGRGLATLWLLAFVAVGAFLVVAYNLELFGGRLPRRALVPGGLGRVPRADRLLRLGRDAARRGVCGGGVRLRHELGAAAALDPGAARPAPGRRGRRRAAARRRDDTAVDATRCAEAETALKLLAAATVLIAGALLLCRAGQLYTWADGADDRFADLLFAAGVVLAALALAGAALRRAAAPRSSRSSPSSRRPRRRRLGRVRPPPRPVARSRCGRADRLRARRRGALAPAPRVEPRRSDGRPARRGAGRPARARRAGEGATAARSSS